MCRKWIKDPEAKAHSYVPGVAKAPNYGFEHRSSPQAKATAKAEESPVNKKPVHKPVHKPAVNTPAVHKPDPVNSAEEKRKAYRREWMRQKRMKKVK